MAHLSSVGDQQVALYCTIQRQVRKSRADLTSHYTPAVLLVTRQTNLRNVATGCTMLDWDACCLAGDCHRAFALKSSIGTSKEQAVWGARQWSERGGAALPARAGDRREELWPRPSGHKHNSRKFGPTAGQV